MHARTHKVPRVHIPAVYGKSMNSEHMVDDTERFEVPDEPRITLGRLSSPGLRLKEQFHILGNKLICFLAEDSHRPCIWMLNMKLQPLSLE